MRGCCISRVDGLSVVHETERTDGKCFTNISEEMLPRMLKIIGMF